MDCKGKYYSALATTLSLEANYALSLPFHIILGIVQFMQLLSFQFNDRINLYSDSPSLLNYLGEVTEYVQITPYIKGIDYDSYLMIFYSEVTFVFLTLLCFIYIFCKSSSRRYPSSAPIHFVKFFGLLFYTVLFLPFNQHFLSVSCLTDDQEISFEVLFPDQKCFSDTEMWHNYMGIFMLVFFNAFAMLICLSIFDYRPSSNDPAARSHSSAYIWLMAYQFTLLFLDAFLEFEYMEMVIVGVILVGSISILREFYFNSPLYNRVLAKEWSALTLANLMGAIILALNSIVGKEEFDDDMDAIWFVGVFYFTALVAFHKDLRLARAYMVICHPLYESIQNKIHCVPKRILAVCQAKEFAEKYLLLYLNVLSKERIVNMMRNDASLDESEAILIELVRKLLLDSANLYPNRHSLKIALALYLIEKSQDKQEAYSILHRLQQENLSYSEEVMVQTSKLLIEEEFLEDSPNLRVGGQILLP